MIPWTDFDTGNTRTTCPSCGRGTHDKTLGLTIEPDGKGVAHCFRCGFVEANRPDRIICRMPSKLKAIKPQKYESLSDFGRTLWKECKSLSGIASMYLKARHCKVPPEAGHLRFHPSLRHPSGYTGPALVALVTNVLTREPLSLQRTWITPTTKADLDTPRLMLGNHSIKNGVIRLWPDEDVTYGLGIAEGIETALSLAWAYTPVWATIDAGHLARFPVLDGVQSLVIAQDQDPAGQAATLICSRNWAQAGREVLVTQQAQNDLNDALREAA